MELAFCPSLKPIPFVNHTSRFVSKPCLRISATSSDSPPSTARFTARRRESISVHLLQKPLSEYMRLPISYYSVLDGERVEKLDDNTFRCHVYRFNIFAYEICPVLLVRVDQQPNGCCINLLSCKLEGSPSVAAQSDNFETSMVNQISCDTIPGDSSIQLLTSDTIIEVSMKLPSTFFTIPVKTIESAGTKVLEQVLRIMLPRFMAQVNTGHKCMEALKSKCAPVESLGHPGMDLQWQWSEGVVTYTCINTRNQRFLITDISTAYLPTFGCKQVVFHLEDENSTRRSMCRLLYLVQGFLQADINYNSSVAEAKRQCYDPYVVAKSR